MLEAIEVFAQPLISDEEHVVTNAFIFTSSGLILMLKNLVEILYWIKEEFKIRVASWVTLNKTSFFKIKLECICRLFYLCSVVISNALRWYLSHSGIQYRHPKRCSQISRIRVISRVWAAQLNHLKVNNAWISGRLPSRVCKHFCIRTKCFYSKVVF